MGPQHPPACTPVAGPDASGEPAMYNIEKLQRTHSFPTIRVQTPPDGSAH